MPSRAKRHRDHAWRPRPSAAERGYDHRWRKIAAEVIAENPLCVKCLARGIYEPAKQVDHIIPHKGNDKLRLDKANCQPLCQPCHTRKTINERGKPR